MRDDLIEDEIGVERLLEILLELVHLGRSEGEEVGAENALRGKSRESVDYSCAQSPLPA